ncbi:MAG: four helix bundle protein [Nitrospirae bacterium]|nr:four helix bundle protein [Nitrospirota bacterium]
MRYLKKREERHKVAEAQRHKVKTYRDLIVWQKAMHLVTQIYSITKSLPKEEVYGLISQIRRSSVSIPSNIAEGYGRNSSNDYIRVLQISIGSLYELQTQLEICLNLKYLSQLMFDDINEKSREIERMLSSLINKLNPKK